MIVWWWQRKALAAARIAEAIAAHALYEVQHSERQADRLAGHGPDREKTASAERHGKYDQEQAITAVYQRTIRLYTHARQRPPKKLLTLVRQALE